MQENAEGAKELKKKMDRLSEPEKSLVLAYIKGMETGTALKDGAAGERKLQRGRGAVVNRGNERRTQGRVTETSSLPQSSTKLFV